MIQNEPADTPPTSLSEDEADSSISGQRVDRVLVCVSAHPLSERLVQSGSQLASSLDADWFTVYVETPDRLRYSSPHRERLARTLQFAEELGGQVESISGRTVPEAITRFAAERGITKIVIGRPDRSRFQELLNGSVVDEILRRSSPADVYVISDPSGPLQSDRRRRWQPTSPLSRYLMGTILVGLVTLISVPIHYVINPTNLVMIYLLAVVAAALFLGRGPSVLVSLLSALAFDFFFIDPRLSFTIADTQYLLTFIGLMVVSLAISNLAGLLRDQVEASRLREEQTAALYALGRELATSLDRPAVLKAVVQHIGRSLKRSAAVLLPGDNGLRIEAADPAFHMNDEEMALAQRAFQSAQATGRRGDDAPDAGVRFDLLVTSRGVLGVLASRSERHESFLSPNQRQMLEAYCSLAALAIERALLAEQANQAQILTAAENLQSALLNSVSHDLRTPLATITGVFSSLHEAERAGQSGPIDMNPGTRLELLETGLEEAERMNRLVGNLLDMTRLEAGVLRLSLTESDVEEVIGAALARLRSRLSERQVSVRLPPERPLVQIDPILVEQVLVNLVDNAIKYSPFGSRIEIEALADESGIEISVLDRGRGIPPEDLPHVFDRFHRIKRRQGAGGTGLGLSICKGIVEAHGGRIWAENRPGGGSRVTFRLPRAEFKAAAGERNHGT